MLPGQQVARQLSHWQAAFHTRFAEATRHVRKLSTPITDLKPFQLSHTSLIEKLEQQFYRSSLRNHGCRALGLTAKNREVTIAVPLCSSVDAHFWVRILSTLH
jgi:hypothetical protein